MAATISLALPLALIAPEARLVCTLICDRASPNRATLAAVTVCVGIFATPVIDTISDDDNDALNPNRTHSSSDVAATLKIIVSPAAKVATMLTF